MWDKIGQIVSNTIKPVGDIIDDINTSEEEKMRAKKEMEKVKNELTSQMIEVQQEELKAKRDVLVTEAKSEHFLTSNWRPITALVFTFIIANNYIIAPYTEAFFNVKVMLKIPPDMWQIIKIMIGGYVGGKSFEVIAGRVSKNHDSRQEDFR
ncbi:hypothetical protein JCM16358_23000 [Halanaerocella petrolearia]